MVRGLSVVHTNTTFTRNPPGVATQPLSAIRLSSAPPDLKRRGQLLELRAWKYKSALNPDQFRQLEGSGKQHYLH